MKMEHEVADKIGGIEWRDVSKRYGQNTVIPSFNLTIEAGEFIALLGPSGCGKSTLLRMLAGLEPVSGGRIAIGGRDVTELAPGQRGIAMVFQQYALYPHMTVRDNMAFGLRNIRMDEAEIERRVAGAAQMLELGALLERKPGQLSGGQRQRVAIGRAVVKEPQAFLFDEPLSNLDAALRTRTRLELARLHKRLKATMLFVTHDQVEAMTLANRIAVMNQGRIEQFAAPMELYDRPATRFVAGFVGSPAMNFLPVRRAPDQNGRCAVVLANGAVLHTSVPAFESNEPLELGLRPDALTPADEGPLRGVVEVIERLGDRTLLHVMLPDGVLVVADAPRRREPAIGATISLHMDLQRAHLFDAAGKAHHPS
ncbi:multiple sugar transport system ATP-binding protein [Duganella sp. HSC-15S17]|uniref:Multiple sugar transport system ATP-binding protein n=2 Tax=Duganella violaceipulchra TaxID=2849652 RepID=A0ABT1GCV5_9BURK|nr:sn-glycerol-3-phosphate ABC transporter ATP-binding protein UgpC [Duganella violaceicalia]MCP2006779.1 multiple sugar transport system ATP-binding protein [Duganella violaceicalia]